MTRALASELQFVLSEIDIARGPEEALTKVATLSRGLRFDVSFADSPQNTQRRWYDFSGLVVMRELHSDISTVQIVQLPNDDDVHVFIDTAHGTVRFDVSRARVSASNPHQLLVNMVFFGILMTLISFIYLRNQLRPITRLAAAAEAFGRGRHVPYSPAGAIEVRAAGNAFLDMRARIERQIEQRTLLLSGVSHDLRTPLTRLRLGLSFLDEADREPLERDVDDMQRMLDEFLNFARGASEVTPEQVNIPKFLKHIVKGATRGNDNVTLKRNNIEGDLQLRKMVMQRAIENLVNNASRYGDRVEISAMQTKRSVVFRVEDNGPGIPEHMRGEALKPFSRLDPARNQDQGSGVGLGLAIAADAARAHGGVLRLGKSDSLGGLQADIVIAI